MKSIEETSNLIQVLISERATSFNEIINMANKVNLRLTAEVLYKEFIPHFFLGRQRGHTTAIINFAKVNPNLRIGVTSFLKQEFEQNFAHLPNVTLLTYDINNTDLLSLDYIIFDDAVRDIKLEVLKKVLSLYSEQEVSQTSPLYSLRILSLGVYR